MVVQVTRRELPFSVLEGFNQSILKEYRSAVREAGVSLREAMRGKAAVSDSEMVLREVTKSLREPMTTVFEIGEEVLVSVGDTVMDAVIHSTEGGLKVRRSDGAIRPVTDLKKVTRKNKPILKEGIWLGKFDVMIPKGSLSYEMEKALEPITERMNKTALCVDGVVANNNLVRVSLEVAELVKKCQELTQNPEFNPGSSKDCAEELQRKRGFGLGRAGKSGVPSVDKAVLQHIADQGDDLAPVIIKAREAQSRLSQLTAWVPFAKAGEVQTHWDQYGQPHGRYSSSEPNLQSRVLEIRETVVAKEGYSFVSADWGMAEYVVWASLAKDSYLGEIFQSGRDLHADMGQSILEAHPDVHVDQCGPRKLGKTINFALLYRMLPWTLAKSLGVDSQKAENLMAEYARKAPAATAYSGVVLKKAARDGFVDTAYGRRLHCPTLGTLKGTALHELQKTVWHHHNAGTAAELLKKKMVEIHSVLEKAGFTEDDVHVAMNMHDEIIYQVRDSKVEEVQKIVYEEMKKPLPGFLPFRVDLRVGKSWLAISK